MGSGAIISQKVICFYFLFFTIFLISLTLCRENSKKLHSSIHITTRVIRSSGKKSAMIHPLKHSNGEFRFKKEAFSKLKNITLTRHNDKLKNISISLLNDKMKNFTSSILHDETKNITVPRHTENESPDSQLDPSEYVASLRIFPSEFHCCSATFISKSVLITSAKCIYGRNPSKAFIHTLSNLLEMSGISVPVKTFHTHPEFESLPPVNDVGIIILWEPLFGVKPLLLPPPIAIDPMLEDVFVHGWQFSNHRKFFQLRVTEGNHISNAKCSLILREKLDCSTTICASNEYIIHGSFDEGLPLIHTEDDSVYIVGVYNRQGIVPEVKIDKYEKVIPHLDWITQFVNQID